MRCRTQNSVMENASGAASALLARPVTSPRMVSIKIFLRCQKDNREQVCGPVEFRKFWAKSRAPKQQQPEISSTAAMLGSARRLPDRDRAQNTYRCYERAPEGPACACGVRFRLAARLWRQMLS